MLGQFAISFDFADFRIFRILSIMHKKSVYGLNKTSSYKNTNHMLWKDYSTPTRPWVTISDDPYFVFVIDVFPRAPIFFTVAPHILQYQLMLFSFPKN